MRISKRRPSRVAINAYFGRHPLTLTGSGQYLSALVTALPSAAPHYQPLLYEPNGRGAATCALTGPGSDGRKASRRGGFGLPEPLAKLYFEQVSFPSAAGWADVLHYPYWAAPLLSARPTVVTVHDLIPLLLPPYRGPLPARAYTALVAAATRRATMIITDSTASQQDICAHLGVAPERIRVIHLAAGESFRPNEDPGRLAMIRVKYGLGASFIFYVGGLDRRKNVDLLIRAFGRARSALPGGCLLAIAGDAERRGSLFPNLRAVASACGAGDAVRFLGVVPATDLPALYQASSAFAFPSSCEGFGLPALEALASGAPVLCSNAASLPEVVGDAAMLLDPADEDAWGAAIVRVLGDEALRDELRRRGPPRAARFSWRKAAEETVAVYDEAAARWQGARGRRPCE